MSRSYEDSVLDLLRNYMEVAREVKRIVRSVDPDARVFVFGSVVRGRYTAASDIDILVVTDRDEEKYRIMVEVYKRVEAPVELHVTTPERFASWYMRFISPEELVEVE